MLARLWLVRRQAKNVLYIASGVENPDNLQGLRFVSIDNQIGIAEGKLKRITQGMGRIKAVRKYENPIEFPETHKLFMDANHKPVVRGSGNAIWNRLHPVPFSITIPPAEIDPELPTKLLASWLRRAYLVAASIHIPWVVLGVLRTRLAKTARG